MKEAADRKFSKSAVIKNKAKKLGSMSFALRIRGRIVRFEQIYLDIKTRRIYREMILNVVHNFSIETSRVGYRLRKIKAHLKALTRYLLKLKF